MFCALRRTQTLLFVAGCGILLVGVQGEEQSKAESAIPALRALLLNKSAVHPKNRCDAARALANIADASVIRDQRIVEALHYVARDWNDHVLVRLEAMSALGHLPITFTGNCAAYAWPFRWILMDEKEDEVIRARAAWLLGRTLLPASLDEEGGAAIMAGIVRNRDEPLMVKVACLDALCRIGGREVLSLAVTELPRLYMDPLLQERLLHALGCALAEHAGGSLKLPSPLVSRVSCLAFSQERPVEVRAEALIVLAHMKRLQMAGAPDLMQEVRNTLKFGIEPALVLAAVRAAGILNEEQTPTALTEAYRSLPEPANVGQAGDVPIRTQIVRGLGEWLCGQTRQRSPDARGIRLAAGLLLEIAGSEMNCREAPAVRQEAFFALQYLYPKRVEFSRFHQGIAMQLLRVLREEPKADAELISAIITTLTIVTRYPGGQELSRWESWYSKTYPGQEIVKLERRMGYR